MHRTITILAVCLFLLSLVIFLTFPRIMSEEIQEKKNELTGNNKGDVVKSENITVVITEIEPIASELVGNDTSPPIKNNTVIAKEVDSKKEETNVVEQISILNSINKENVNNSVKESKLDELKQEIVRAEDDLAAKVKRLDGIKKRTNSAQDLSTKAYNHLKSLIFALNSLQGSLLQSSKAAFETDWQLQLQTAMYDEAKRKYARLSRELELTKTDYEKTKAAAQSAMMAAKIAQMNTHNADPASKFFLGHFGTDV